MVIFVEERKLSKPLLNIYFHFHVPFSKEPKYDEFGIWQAITVDLFSSALQTHVDKRSASPNHYAFLSGPDAAGASGVAFLGSACFAFPDSKINIACTHANINYYIKYSFISYALF